MKKIIYILLMVTLVLSACEKGNGDIYNQDNNNNNNSELLGSWDFTEYHEIYEEGYYLGGYPNGTKITTNSQNVIMLPGDTSWGIESVNWNFTSDGLLTATFAYTNDNYVDVQTTSWEENGNTLTIDTNEIYTITSLTSNFLSLHMHNEDTSTHYWDPTNDTVYFYKGDLTIKWNRTSIIPENNNNAKLIQDPGYSFFKSFIKRKRK